MASTIVKNFPVETEREWIGLAQGSDLAQARLAIGWLIEQFDPLLWKLATKVNSRGLGLDDLHSQAVVHFIHAVKTFNLDFDIRLTTYLYRVVETQLWRDSVTQGLIALPYSVSEVNAEYRQQAMQAKSYGFGWSHSATEEGVDRVECLHCTDPSPLESLMTTEEVRIEHDELAALRLEISRLPADQKRVIELRLQGYGLSLIGESMGFTKEWIRKLEAQAIQTLRRNLTGTTDTADTATISIAECITPQDRKLDGRKKVKDSAAVKRDKRFQRMLSNLSTGNGAK